MKKYFIGLSIVIGCLIIAAAGICSSESCQINLMGFADFSQIIIALGAIGSIMFAVATIRESDWSLAMAYVPSLAIRPGYIFIFRTLEIGGRMQPNGPFEKGWSGETSSLTIQFSCENLGRGPAFNIKRPIVTTDVAYEEQSPTPLYMTSRTIDDEKFNFNISVDKSFDEWIANGNKKIPVRIEVRYTNDQKNVQCCSWWKAEILPFDVDGNKLVPRKLTVLSREAGVDYSPIKSRS